MTDISVANTRQAQRPALTVVPTASRRSASRHHRLLLAGLVGIDVLCVVLAVSSADALRLVLDGVLPVSSLTTERHFLASVIVIPVLLGLLWAQGLYDLDQVLAGTREYARIGHAVTYAVFLALGVSYFAGGPPLISRSWLVLICLLSIVFVAAGRLLARQMVRQLRRRGLLRARVLIVGASTLGVAVARQLRATPGEGLDVVGFLDEFLPLGHPLVNDLVVLGRPGDLVDGRAACLADECILIPQSLPFQRVQEISRLMVSHDAPVLRLAINPEELLTNGLQVTDRANVPLVTLRRARIGGIEAALKCTLDRVGATLALGLLSPLVLAVLVRGWLHGSRSFICRYRIQAPTGQITLRVLQPSLAAWPPLRGAPALLAVMAGHLSLVGPRPTIWQPSQPLPADVSLTAVKPGLTGPWRLSGPDAPLAVQAMQDLRYVRHYTIWEDVRILWETVRLLRSGAVTPLLGRWQRASSRDSGAA